MATKDGRTQIWYADGNGSVDGYTETVGDIAETIIGAYNEHFGTDIQLWTPETKTLQVGGTVPSWNAYEKITLQTVKIKFQGGIFGEVRGKKLYIATSNGINVIIVNMQTGLVATLNGSELTEQMKTNYTAGMRYYGYEVSETTSETLTLEVGDQIEGWDEYVLIQ